MLLLFLVVIETCPDMYHVPKSLLTSVNLHAVRFMLKSLGLWKSLYEDDSSYPQDNDHFEIVQDESSNEVCLSTLDLLPTEHLKNNISNPLISQKLKKKDEKDKKKEDKTVGDSADSVRTAHSDPGARRVSICEQGMQCKFGTLL